MRRVLGFCFLLFISISNSNAQTLRIGLAEDPDILDPTLARTFVGRIVFSALCDKLFDLDEKLSIVPMLATSHEWSKDYKALTLKIRPGVTFHDGEKLDAAAVKFNLERHKTMQGSNRRGELAPVAGVDVLDAQTVRINLAAPFAPLLAILTDRAGMMVSPKAAAAAGEKFGANPVCSGPFKFVERVAQDRIVLERYPGYWNKGAIHFERVTYLPIVDATVRLANLKSGGLDLMERVLATDIKTVRDNPKLKLINAVELGYQGLTINLSNGPKAVSPLAKDARVRQAFELSIDRDALNQVVFNGEFVVGNQWINPTNPYYQQSLPVPKRDLAKAKALLLAAAGVTNPSFTLMTPTNTDQLKIAQVVQAMAREAGFDVKIQATEFATSLDLADKGQFDAYVLAWSGRPDPDGNLFSHLACRQPLDYSGHCKPEVDELINRSRATIDPAARQKLFEQIAASIAAERPIIYLYHRHWLWAYASKLSGFRTVPDGMVRVQGLKM